MKKTPKSVRRITSAFLELRASMPLEKIMVTRLCEKADINKSTFYAYFRDIYDLSDQLENEAVQRIVRSLPEPEVIMNDSTAFMAALLNAFHASGSLISVLFSDNRTSALGEKIEQAVKQLCFAAFPEKQNDARVNITLSYEIYGALYAYFRNPYKEEIRTEIIASLTK